MRRRHLQGFISSQAFHAKGKERGSATTPSKKGSVIHHEESGERSRARKQEEEERGKGAAMDLANGIRMAPGS